MDTASLLVVAIKSAWWAIPLFMIAVLSGTPAVKGYFGELFVNIVGRIKLDKDVYHSVHNVTLELDDGTTTQIDHLYVSKFGVFVVETKNMKGWIFGAEHQETWTQKIFKTSNKFQNPLRQNYRHTLAVIEKLNLAESSVFSVIAFVGECELKSKFPGNVTRGVGYIGYIKKHSTTIFSDKEVRNIIADVNSKKLSSSIATKKKHIKNLSDRHEAELDTSGIPSCSKCGNSMVERVARKGVNVGSKFFGCSTFPRCKFTRPIV